MPLQFFFILVMILLLVLKYIGLRMGYIVREPVEYTKSQRLAYALIIGCIISISGGYFILLGTFIGVYFFSVKKFYKIKWRKNSRRV